MTKCEAEKHFRVFILPNVVGMYGADDRIALVEEWNAYTDALCKEGAITLRQYETWTNPF